MSIYLETAKKQIEKGTVGLDAIKSNLTRHIEAENKAKWDSDMRAEYDELYPEHRDMTDAEKSSEYISDCIYRDDMGWEHIPIEDFEYPKVTIDYSEDESYMTFEEWLNETIVVSEAIEATYDEDGMELTPYVPEVTELVRPYVAPEVTDAEIDELLSTIGYVSKEVVDALKYLADTDWYYIRYVDNGTAIPQEVMDKRAEARLIV